MVDAEKRLADVGNEGPPVSAGGRTVIGAVLVGVSSISGGVVAAILLSPWRNWRTGEAVGLDDALGEQVQHLVPARRLIGREHMVEGAVLADDDDDVLDGRARPGGRVRPRVSDGRREGMGEDGANADEGLEEPAISIA